MKSKYNEEQLSIANVAIHNEFSEDEIIWAM